jgi:AraC family transcriptional regulator
VSIQKNNLAAKLPPLWSAFLARMGEIAGRLPGPARLAYGLLRPIDDESDQLQYVACVPVTGDATVPRGMVSLSLSASRYACFTHQGPVSALDHTVKYAYSSWLLGSGQQHSGSWDIEIYGEQYHPTDPASVIHYAMPIACTTA